MYSRPVSFEVLGALYKIYLTRSGETLGFLEVFSEQLRGLTSPQRHCCCPCRSPWRQSQQRSERESAPAPTWLDSHAHSSTLCNVVQIWHQTITCVHFVSFHPHSEKGEKTGLVLCFGLNAALAVTSGSVFVCYYYWRRSMFGQFHPTYTHTKVFSLPTLAFMSKRITLHYIFWRIFAVFMQNCSRLERPGRPADGSSCREPFQVTIIESAFKKNQFSVRESTRNKTKRAHLPLRKKGTLTESSARLCSVPLHHLHFIALCPVPIHQSGQSTLW